MLAKAGNAVDDLQCGTHPPRYLRGRAASRRRRRRIRRSRTTARASTAGCSPTACSADCRRRATSPSTIRCSRRSARAVAHFTSTPEDELVAASTAARRRTTRCRSIGSRWRFARLAARRRRRRLRARAAGPRRRDDRASGNGLGRAAAATSSSCAPGAATGWPRSAPKACRRSAFAARGIGIAIKVADGNKRALRPVIVAVLEQLGLLDARRARRPRALVRAGRAQLPRHRHRDGSCPVVVLDKAAAPADALRCRRNNPTSR